VNTPENIGILVAFAAGVLSFLSPCVLPLVPSYLGFLTGMTLEEMTGRRRLAMVHALLFVSGFALVFVLIILFGLYAMGVFKLRFLQMEKRVQLERKPLGYLGSVLVGMAFAAGWTPCIGPILGGILGMAATQGDVSRGMVLLGSYSAGLAVPFLVAAWAMESFLDWFQRFRKYLPWVMRLSGLLLIFVGLLMVTGEFTRLAGWLQGLTPAFLRGRL